MKRQFLFIVFIHMVIHITISTYAQTSNKLKNDEEIDQKITVTIYYRWDKHDLDTTYLTNEKTLQQIDSILHLKSADYIDSLKIVAYASPEGAPDYNQRLSERRSQTLKNYILSTYPRFRDNQIITQARGENWEGFRRMALEDDQLHMKKQVLDIIDNLNINNIERQEQIVRLDSGKLYKNYILPNYYRFLRSGASFFVIYNPEMSADIDLEPVAEVMIEAELVPDPKIEQKQQIIEPEPIVKFPIALRTNLLYDAIGAGNLGIEIPFGTNKHGSFIADMAYAYWRGSKNLHAFQTLEYGTELRYWFGVSNKKKERNKNWKKPLKGWNVGIYGRYWQRYDVQWIDGFQGDNSWSAGLTAGYAWPIGKRLSLESSLGIGWFSSKEYRHYHKPEYNKDGTYRLMWQKTGKWSGFTLTKIRFSLVWLIEYTGKKTTK